MSRRAAAALLVVLASACANPDEVRGVVIDVQGDLTSVERFVIRIDGGDLIEVVPAEHGDFAFPLPHLHDHRASLAPILVELDRSTDPPTAVAIRDADTAEWHE